MFIFSNHLNYCADAPVAPVELVQEAERANSVISTMAEAKAAFDTFLPMLSQFAPNARLFFACGMLLEKHRGAEGMLESWKDLQSIFNDHLEATKMLMRWYRRSRQVDEGLQRLHQIVPDVQSNVGQVERRLTGYLELHAYAELDEMMRKVLPLFECNRSLKVKYVKALTKQDRFIEAARISRTIEDREKLGKTSRNLLNAVEERALCMKQHKVDEISCVLGFMVEQFQIRKPRPLQPGGVGPFVFFTGQLGAGGAERQMTRIASAYQRIWDSGEPRIGRHTMLAPPAVCVRHASPSSGADFFMPVLRESGVRTEILEDMDDPGAEVLGPEISNVHKYFSFLPEDLQTNTRKLTSFFRKNEFDTVYLWQDGGVLAAALAALLAGVPRIVTSFRDSPPSMRPELMRPQMPGLYKSLANVPGVSFSANSQAAATAYENWLGLTAGTIGVVINAVPPITPDGTDEDERRWSEISSASKACLRTVVGIFRFDQNKRPDYWVQIAADFARKHSDTRFVVLGSGVEYNKCKRLVEDGAMSHRVFLPGPTNNIGFYLHHADVLMHLARMEGLPNVIIEAQLAGTPVLATPAGGTGEIIADGKTGLLLSDSLNPETEEVFRKLEFLLADTDLLARMGAAAVKLAKDRFAIDRVLESTLSLFELNREECTPEYT